MRIRNWTLAIPVAASLAVIAVQALAAIGMYATEASAVQACGTDTVVWVNLDRGRYYEKDNADYGKGGNGGYTCLKVAHASYRPGH
jgi:hypothetical protein